MKMKHYLPRALFGIAVFLFLSAETCGDLIEDSGFDIWCEDELCRWDVEKGDVARVPSWHQRDHAVELIGDPAAISQLNMEDNTTVQCIRFRLLADIEEAASVTLEVDFDDDGEVELPQIIPTSDWEPLSYLFTAPDTFSHIRFRIRKSGPGRAVLAEIAAEKSGQCGAKKGPALLRGP